MSRCQSLPGGAGIQCRIPVPTVEGVVGPIPLGEWALKQIKADLPKYQVIGHTKSQCRSRVTRCSRCGAGGHAVEGCSNTLSCINCNGGHSAAFRQCPQMVVHARVQVLRSGSYIPFSVALQRARVELLGGPVLPEPTGRQDFKPRPDRCWAVDRAAVAAIPLTTGSFVRHCGCARGWRP